MNRLKDRRKEMFAKEYARTGNAERSALSAGYSEKYARAKAYKLLANVGISERIREIHEETEKRLIEHAELEPPMSDEELLSLLYAIARKRPFKGRSFKTVTENNGTVIKETEYQYSPSTDEQLSALDKIARIKGLYNDKLSINSNVRYNVNFDV
jgi:Phage terminase, small subunit